MKTKNHIALHNQDVRAIGGIDIRGGSFSGALEEQYALEAHRDEYYIFAFLIKGNATIECDMQTLAAKGPALMVIKPFQVHSGAINNNISGYFISIAPFLIPPDCAAIFQGLSIAEQVMPIPTAQKKELIDTVSLLHRSFNEVNSNKQQIINGIFTSLVYRIAALYKSAESPGLKMLHQPERITAEFRKLTMLHALSRPPSWFAGKLNITTSHLNDCVKATTGFSVTHWLQDAIITEAKRLLYYTNSDVKQIAFDLGFEDHAYFSRLFRKVARETPLAFRKRFRE